MSSFDDHLVRWYDQVREEYFFRQNRNPYRVWVSEVALQQTRIQAALPPLQRFLAAFPDVTSLAGASEDDVLTAFKGLGYYNRARNLRKGAQYLVEHHGGLLPRSYAELLNVPSIGSYTAAAVASICFDERVAVLDGNVKRVVSRLQLLEEPTNSKEFAHSCHKFLDPLLQESSLPPGKINEALMELGQKVCLKATPLCAQCSVHSYCGAFSAGRQKELPVQPPKRKPLAVDWHLFIQRDEKGRILLHRPEDAYFLRGQWQFPSILVFPDGSKKASLPGLAVPDVNGQPRRLSHTITHHKLSLFLHRGSMHGAGLQPVAETELESYLVASAMTKAWAAFSLP